MVELLIFILHHSRDPASLAVNTFYFAVVVSNRGFRRSPSQGYEWPCLSAGLKLWLLTTNHAETRIEKPRKDFKRTAKYLAQLSEDYTADPDDAFSRIDLNSDHRIDRTEFEQEINEIRGLLGTRKLAAALAQVQQDCQIRQSFADAQPAEQAGELNLGARTQALEEMVDYFSTLTKDYTARLEELKQKQELQTEEIGRAHV